MWKLTCCMSTPSTVVITFSKFWEGNENGFVPESILEHERTPAISKIYK